MENSKKFRKPTPEEIKLIEEIKALDNLEKYILNKIQEVNMLRIKLDSSKKFRKLLPEEIKEYLQDITFKQLIEEYVLQTDNLNALNDLRKYIIEWIVDYHIHEELYPDKLVVRI